MLTHPQSRAAQVWPNVPVPAFHPLKASQIKENHFQTVMNCLLSRVFAWSPPLRKCECFCWLWKCGGDAPVLSRCEEPAGTHLHPHNAALGVHRLTPSCVGMELCHNTSSQLGWIPNHFASDLTCFISLALSFPAMAAACDLLLHGPKSGLMICPILWRAVSQRWHFRASTSLHTDLLKHFPSSRPS